MILLRVHLAGEVRDFDAKDFIGKQYRKSLKIMSRSMQMGVVAAQQAWAAVHAFSDALARWQHAWPA